MPGHPWLWLVYTGIRLFQKDQHFAKVQCESDMYNTSELHCMDPHCRYSTAITTWRQEITMRFQGAYYILTCMILGWWSYRVYIPEQIDERDFARAIYIQFPKMHDPIVYNVSVSNNGYLSLDRLRSLEQCNNWPCFGNVTLLFCPHDHDSRTITVQCQELFCDTKKLIIFWRADSRHFIFTSSLMKFSEIKRHQTSKISGSISQ